MFFISIALAILLALVFLTAIIVLNSRGLWLVDNVGELTDTQKQELINTNNIGGLCRYIAVCLFSLCLYIVAIWVGCYLKMQQLILYSSIVEIIFIVISIIFINAARRYNIQTYRKIKERNKKAQQSIIATTSKKGEDIVIPEGYAVKNIEVVPEDSITTSAPVITAVAPTKETRRKHTAEEIIQMAGADTSLQGAPTQTQTYTPVKKAPLPTAGYVPAKKEPLPATGYVPMKKEPLPTTGFTPVKKEPLPSVGFVPAKKEPLPAVNMPAPNINTPETTSPAYETPNVDVEMPEINLPRFVPKKPKMAKKFALSEEDKLKVQKLQEEQELQEAQQEAQKAESQNNNITADEVISTESIKNNNSPKPKNSSTVKKPKPVAHTDKKVTKKSTNAKTTKKKSVKPKKEEK